MEIDLGKKEEVEALLKIYGLQKGRPACRKETQDKLEGLLAIFKEEEIIVSIGMGGLTDEAMAKTLQEGVVIGEVYAGTGIMECYRVETKYKGALNYHHVMGDDPRYVSIAAILSIRPRGKFRHQS